MFYLISQILFCLLIAALLGFILGWLIRGLFARRKEQYLINQSNVLKDIYSNFEASAARTQSSNDDSKSLYEITEIEGIGKGYAKMLAKINIFTTEDLLNKSNTAAEIQAISKAAGGIEDFVVKKWCSMADLVRIDGIRGQFAELLEASDISSVENLSKQNVNKLTKKMADVNDRENRTRTNPTTEMVADWISKAQKL